MCYKIISFTVTNTNSNQLCMHTKIHITNIFNNKMIPYAKHFRENYYLHPYACITFSFSLILNLYFSPIETFFIFNNLVTKSNKQYAEKMGITSLFRIFLLKELHVYFNIIKILIHVFSIFLFTLFFFKLIQNIIIIFLKDKILST